MSFDSNKEHSANSISDSYLTIERDSEIETKVKGSRFIARAILSVSREAAEETLAFWRKKEFDATHHCFSYIIQGEFSPEALDSSPDRNIFRYSDDGEPSGSAGKPIYDQLLGRHLVDTLLVVTRYYGGTKLGVGGLVRAYSEAASLALDQAGQLRKYHYSSFRLETDFSQYQQVLNLLNELAGEIDNSEFSDRVRLSIRLRYSSASEFKAKFIELTHGKGILEKTTKSR